MDDIWVKRKESGYELAGAISGSLVIHVLMFFLLTSTSIYYPAAGDVAQFDIFWFSPSTSPKEGPSPAATPKVVTAANVIAEQAEITTDKTKTLQLPVIDKNTEPPAEQSPKQTDEPPPLN